jgi:hypothetical protein
MKGSHICEQIPDELLPDEIRNFKQHGYRRNIQ